MKPAIAWDPAFLDRSPAFDALRAACDGVDLADWPGIEAVNRRVGAGAQPPCNAAGRNISFVPAVAAGAVVYEGRIHEAGEVVLRERDWHDWMNALVWMTFPRAKAVLNARHIAAMAAELSGQRGRMRDALTLFDEGGAIVLSSDPAVLEGIAGFRWKEMLWQRRTHFLATTRVLIFGHAMYEKLLEPFVGVTALSLLVTAPPAVIEADVTVQTRFADERVAALLEDESRLRTPRDLAPLPILGVPGWFARNTVESFYDDVSYFRPGRGRAARSAPDRVPPPAPRP